jgi:uncharacterized protein (TIGR00369 family)
MNDQTIQPLSDEALLERFQRAKRLPASSQTLGFRMLGLSQAEMSVEVEFEAKGELFVNTMGRVQGGFLCAMLDECMSVACRVASQLAMVAPTLEMKTSFFRPALPGKIRGVGRVVKWGRQAAFTEAELYDPQGRLLAKATATAIPTPMERPKKEGS